MNRGQLKKGHCNPGRSEAKMGYPRLQIRLKARAKLINRQRLVERDKIAIELAVTSCWGLLLSRTGGQFAGKAYWLNPNFDWVIGRDDEDQLVIVPLKKA